ncbi:MAG TPA: hypothetical protein VGE07_07250 [Herpetosiphonaceae bacterium]
MLRLILTLPSITILVCPLLELEWPALGSATLAGVALILWQTFGRKRRSR